MTLMATTSAPSAPSSRGATTEPFEVSSDMAAVARRAAAEVGAVVAGVDLLPARSGQQFVLEVNAVPGWRALARTLKVDIAELFLDYVVLCVKRRQ